MKTMPKIYQKYTKFKCFAAKYTAPNTVLGGTPSMFPATIPITQSAYADPRPYVMINKRHNTRGVSSAQRDDMMATATAAANTPTNTHVTVCKTAMEDQFCSKRSRTPAIPAAIPGITGEGWSEQVTGY